MPNFIAGGIVARLRIRFYWSGNLGHLSSIAAAIAACAALAYGAVGCSQAPPLRPSSASQPQDRPVADSPDGGQPRPPPLTEAAARAILAREFRAHGLRIRLDVPVVISAVADEPLVVDGFDPAAQIGFEYLASPDRARWGAGEGPIREGSIRVLRIAPVDQGTAVFLAREFLRSVLP